MLIIYKMTDGYNFFDYNNYLSQKIQFKTPQIVSISGDDYIFIPLRYKNMEIFLKTPKIVVPFGLNLYISETLTKSYYYSLSFTDMDIDPNIKLFYDYLKKMEKFCQKIVKKRLCEWSNDLAFGNLTFKSCFKDKTDLFRLKISTLTEIYGINGESHQLIDCENLITNQCQIISLIQPSNIWISPNEYGLTWKVHQIRVYPCNRPFGGSLLNETITIHGVKIIENKMDHETSGVPMAPPIAPPLAPKSRIPLGGVSMLPFLSSIQGGGFQLKKSAHDTNNKKKPKNDFPEISLQEILNIRNKLKKQPPK